MRRAVERWVVALGLCIAAAGPAPARQALYQDPNAPVEARVEDLLGRMTLEEKVARMLCIWDEKSAAFDAKLELDPRKMAQKYPDGVGQFARPSDATGPVSPRLVPGRDVRATVRLVNALQRFALRHTRLGIPIMFHEEGLHGYAAVGATSFPQAIALASSWDPALVRAVNAVTAREIRARGVSEALTPVVDVARDPRWGRIEETYGEDPYLVSQMGLAAIRGFQGPILPLPQEKVFVTLKHFTGHGWPESGTNVGPAHVGERELREIFFPPFEAAVKTYPVRSVMASYNEIDGIPSHANNWLLNGVLRGEWGYQGAVVSDYYGIRELVTRHHLYSNVRDAAERSLKSGVDVETPDPEAYVHLP